MPADERREITRPLWLFLLEQGGRWNAGELAKCLELDQTDTCSALRQAFDHGIVKRHVPTEYGKTLAYEVDDDCRLPRGLWLREVKAALAAHGPAVPPGWRLVPVDPPAHLQPVLTGYGLDPFMSDHDRAVVAERLRTRWAQILAAVPGPGVAGGA